VPAANRSSGVADDPQQTDHTRRSVAAAASREWDGDFLSCVLSAIAAAKGFPTVAEAALELSPDIATEFIDWFFER
jgi:hypothetical protein